MNEKRYRVITGAGKPVIYEFDVVSFSSKMLVRILRGEEQRRKNDGNYFETYEDAYSEMLARCERNVRRAQSELDQEKNNLAIAKNFQKSQVENVSILK